ncbi:MAG: hypothetical protein JW929_06800 [Anaerolineales bacterium]|nr:hypothetical protein [Anaerolineales bacterium]
MRPPARPHSEWIPLKQTGVLATALLLGALAAGCALAPAGPQAAAPTFPNPPTFTFPAAVPPGDSRRTLIVGGFERSYLLHVPAGVHARTPLPLVLVFHGHRMTAAEGLAETGFNDLADRHGFLAAYPEGTGPAGAQSFNAGLCCGSAEANRVDESEFVRLILADLNRSYAVDPARIYAAGFSNGAMLSYRLACEMADTFAAVAPVAGNLVFGPCRPEAGVSLIHIQGLSDASMPYADADLDADSDPAILSVEGGIAFWASVNGCPESPETDREGRVIRRNYPSCAGGTSVVLYSLEGVGHVWPADPVFPASQAIWDFFAAHPKPDKQP